MISIVPVVYLEPQYEKIFKLKSLFETVIVATFIAFGVYWVMSAIWHGFSGLLSFSDLDVRDIIDIVSSVPSWAWADFSILDIGLNIIRIIVVILVVVLLGLLTSLTALGLVLFEGEFWLIGLPFLEIGFINGVVAFFMGYLKRNPNLN